jgi:hypothetical protein
MAIEARNRAEVRCPCCNSVIEVSLSTSIAGVHYDLSPEALDQRIANLATSVVNIARDLRTLKEKLERRSYGC